MTRNSIIISGVMLLVFGFIYADTFTKEDVIRWQKEFDAAAKYGRQLWENSASFKLGTNNVACAQCHPNATNTHPETYPKFQKQLGRVVSLAEMVNWCIINPLEGKPLKLDSKEMVALLAYIHSERRGVKLAPGKH
ncbi:MAG: cytochrome C [Spirochaetes bacterium]|nr:cytochrome C [Spirochaetota bacterium]